VEAEKKFKVNWVDAAVLAVILLAAGFFVWQYAIGGDDDDAAAKRSGASLHPVIFEFGNYEVIDDTFNNGRINIGDTVYDRTTGVELGVITGIDVKPARSDTVDANGNFVVTSRPHRSFLTVTAQGTGFRPDEGGLQIDEWHGLVNTEYAFIIGDGAFWVRFFSFTLDESVIAQSGR
jgi:hypothetical protein